MKNKIRTYFGRLGTAMSVLINVIFGGQSNQTISARNWESHRQGKFNISPLINLIYNDQYHCVESWSYWKVRKSIVNVNTTNFTIDSET